MQPNKSEAVEVTPLREQIAVDAARIAAMSPETRAILEQELANILGNPGITFASQREPSEGEALGPKQRCPACHAEFQYVHDVDAHLAALRPTDAPTRIKHYRAAPVIVEDDAGEASERAMIVAYWRRYERRSEYTPTEVADIIERGDFLQLPPAQETE